jgi:hypothetical protein
LQIPGAKLKANIQAGARVRILEPAYVAGKTGIIVCLEPSSNGLMSGRWLIQVEDEEILLSLDPGQFLVFG